MKDKKGNFGTINKNQKKYHIKETMILHQNNPVHTWCAKRLKQLAADKAKAEEVNLKAATLVATNAAFCLKTFGSAKDFVRENDKDNLTGIRLLLMLVLLVTQKVFLLLVSAGST